MGARKRKSGSVGRTAADVERLVAELTDLYENGGTYVEAIEAFKGRRTRTWIIRYWPKYPSLDRLRALYHRGFPIDEVVKKFSPSLTPWVRLHWPASDEMPVQHANIYESQNVRPTVRLVPIADAA